MPYYRTNRDIDEYLGLGEAYGSMPSRLLGDAGPDQVRAGDRVQYTVEADLNNWTSLGGKGYAQNLQDRLNMPGGEFTNAHVTFPDVYLVRGTLVVELTSITDRYSINDIAANVRTEAANAGFDDFTSEQINFISHAQPGQGYIPTVQPYFNQQGAVPPSSSGSLWDSLKKDLSVSGTTLGIAAAIIGVALFIGMER